MPLRLTDDQNIISKSKHFDENDSSMGTSELQERIEASPGFWRRLFNRRGSRANDASSVGTTPADGSVRAKAVRKSLDFLAYF